MQDADICKSVMSDFMLMAQNWNSCGICKHYLFCIQIVSNYHLTAGRLFFSIRKWVPLHFSFLISLSSWTLPATPKFSRFFFTGIETWQLGALSFSSWWVIVAQMTNKTSNLGQNNKSWTCAFLWGEVVLHLSSSPDEHVHVWLWKQPGLPLVGRFTMSRNGLRTGPFCCATFRLEDFLESVWFVCCISGLCAPRLHHVPKMMARHQKMADRTAKSNAQAPKRGHQRHSNDAFWFRFLVAFFVTWTCKTVHPYFLLMENMQQLKCICKFHCREKTGATYGQRLG